MTTSRLQTATRKTYIAQTRQLFYCHCKIKVPLAIGETILDDCFTLMEQADRRYNSYQHGSYFDQLNRAAGSWVTVDETTIDALQTLKKISSLTDGAYAITSMPLLKLWGFYEKDKQHIPAAAELSETLRRINDEAIEIDGDRVRIQKNQALITGSFAKAIAVDHVVAYLASHGVTDAVVNAGGSTIFAINDTTHPHWNIRVPDVISEGENYHRLALANSCFSLSGQMNNHILINGKRYSHILHGKTGWPAATQQVMLRSQQAFLGDALSTALFVVAPQERDKIINRLSQHFSFNYCRIEENGDQIQSTCF